MAICYSNFTVIVCFLVIFVTIIIKISTIIIIIIIATVIINIKMFFSLFCFVYDYDPKTLLEIVIRRF